MNTTTHQQIAFVLDNAADYQSLVAGIPSGTPVYVLESSGDVLAQMAAITSGYSNLDAIHLYSHGSDGTLNLGSITLDSSNLNNHATILAQIGSSLSQSGDILLYGCNVAEGQAGVKFISKLSQVTGADISASDDLSGASDKGGDWVLEAASGDIEAKAFTINNFGSTLGASGSPIYDFEGPTTAVSGTEVTFATNGHTLDVTSNSGNVTYTSNSGLNYLSTSTNGAGQIHLHFTNGETFNATSIDLRAMTGTLSSTYLMITSNDATNPGIEVFGTDGTLNETTFATINLSMFAGATDIYIQGWSGGAIPGIEIDNFTVDFPVANIAPTFDGVLSSTFGAAGSNSASLGNDVKHVATAMGADGIQYVAYDNPVDFNNSGKVSVSKQVNGEWVQVGSPEFSFGTNANRLSLSVSQDGTPYVMFCDSTDNYKAKVMKYTGVGDSGWEQVGEALSVGSAGATEFSLQVANDGSVYAAFTETDVNSTYAAKLMKFDGTSWSAVGTDPSISNGYMTAFAMSPVDQSPYVFIYDGNTATGSVKHFDGTNWVQVGDMTSSASDFSLAFKADGTLIRGFISYIDSKYEITSWNGTTWTQVAIVDYTDAFEAFPSIALDAADNIYLVSGSYGTGNYTLKMFDGTTWSALGSDMGPFDTMGGSPAQLLVNPNGQVSVVWSGFSNDPYGAIDAQISNGSIGTFLPLYIAENQTTVTGLSITDPENDAVTISIVGGADQAKFQVVDNALQFVNAPDYETPTDASANNVYEVQLKATDALNNETTVLAKVQVADINEGGSSNTAPTISNVPASAQSVTTSVAANLDNFTVADTDGDTLTVTLTASNGTINNLTDADANTANIQLTGAATDINTALAGATFTATADGAASIGISVNDGTAAPVTGTYNLTAVTAAEDITPPTIDLENSSPADNATNIAIDTTSIEIAFSENIAFGTGLIFLAEEDSFLVGCLYEGGALAQATSGVTMSISGNKLTISFATPILSAGKLYTAAIGDGAIVDTAGNPIALSIDYTFTTAAATAPEIAVSYFGVNITDGDNTPSDPEVSDDGTIFFQTDFGETTTNRYMIVNSGDANLNIGDITITGAHASDFSVVSLTIDGVAATVVPSGVEARLEILFTPSAAGNRSAEISIANNDSDENPFNFSIQGLGVGSSNTAPVNTILENYTNVNFTTIGSYTNGAEVDTNSSSNIPNITVFFEADNNGSENFKVFDVAGSGTAGVSHSTGLPNWFHIATGNDAVDFDITSFKVYNGSGSSQSLTVNGYDTGYAYSALAAGMGGSDVPRMTTTVNVAAGEWTTVNLTGFTGISSLLIDTPDNTQMYFNEFNIRAAAAYTTDEDTVLSITDLTVADAEMDTLTVTLSVDKGTINLPNINTATNITAIDADGLDGSLTFSGMADDINLILDEGVDFYAAANENGNGYATLTMTTSDGTADNVVNTAAINVSAVNDTPTFNDGGLFWDNFNRSGDSTYSSDRIAESYASAMQPDGKIVMVGYAEVHGGTGAIAMVRLNTDGSLDESFGEFGELIIEGYYGAESVAIQPDGKILIAGIDEYDKLFLARFNVDGSIDSDFATSGEWH